MNNFEKLFPYLTDLSGVKEDIDYDKLNKVNNKIIIEKVDVVTNKDNVINDNISEKNTTDIKKDEVKTKTDNIVLPDNIKDIDFAIKNIKKLQSALNGNPIGFIDLLNTNGKMNNALTIIKQMPSIMRALGNDIDKNDDFFRENTKADTDIHDNSNIKIKTQSNIKDTQQTVIFNLNDSKTQNFSSSAKFKIRQDVDEQKNDDSNKNKQDNNLNETHSDGQNNNNNENKNENDNNSNGNTPNFMNFFNGLNNNDKNSNEKNENGNNFMNMFSNIMKMQNSMQNGDNVNLFNAFQPNFNSVNQGSNENKSFMEQIKDSLNK